MESNKEKNFTDDWKKAIRNYNTENNIPAACSILDIIVFGKPGEKNQIIPIGEYAKENSINLSEMV